MLWSVSDKDHGDQVVLDWPYFGDVGPQKTVEERSYAGTGSVAHPTQYDFTHGIGETVTALMKAGLALEFLHEHKFIDWQAFPLLERAGGGKWKMPAGRENYLPLTFSIRAHKPV